jgi:hypothetical protein
MIHVKAENGVVEIRIPTDGMSPKQINESVTWLRTEGIARHSKLKEDAAWQLSEEIKGSRWDKNRRRFSE